MSAIVHKTKSDLVADAMIYTLLGLFSLATLFPLYYVFVMSVTPFSEVLRNGGFIIFPREFTFSAYFEIFSSRRIPDALKITVLITVLGTFFKFACHNNAGLSVV
mgnify:CR=1 FL=1